MMWPPSPSKKQNKNKTENPRRSNPNKSAWHGKTKKTHTKKTPPNKYPNISQSSRQMFNLIFVISHPVLRNITAAHDLWSVTLFPRTWLEYNNWDIWKVQLLQVENPVGVKEKRPSTTATPKKEKFQSANSNLKAYISDRTVCDWALLTRGSIK